MIDPRNTVILTCGVVMDPETAGNNNDILKLRVGVDFAGSEKGSEQTSGFFDVVYYMNNTDNTRNTKFVRDQFEAGNLGKGSQIQLVGRLVQERWSTDENKKGQRVTIVAESISYVKGQKSASTDGGATSSSSASSSSGSLPTEF